MSFLPQPIAAYVIAVHLHSALTTRGCAVQRPACRRGSRNLVSSLQVATGLAYYGEGSGGDHPSCLSLLLPHMTGYNAPACLLSNMPLSSRSRWPRSQHPLWSSSSCIAGQRLLPTSTCRFAGRLHLLKHKWCLLRSKTAYEIFNQKQKCTNNAPGFGQH